MFSGCITEYSEKCPAQDTEYPKMFPVKPQIISMYPGWITDCTVMFHAQVLEYPEKYSRCVTEYPQTYPGWLTDYSEVYPVQDTEYPAMFPG